MAITLQQPICLAASLCFATYCATVGAKSIGCAGRPAAAPIERRLLIFGAHGRLLQRSHYVFLHGGHVGVPVGVFQKLGLSVGFYDHGRKIMVGEDETDAVVDLTLGGNTAFSPAAPTEADAYDHYDYPLARRIGGQVYVSVEVIGEGFSDWLTVKRNSRTHTLTLRRRSD